MESPTRPDVLAPQVRQAMTELDRRLAWSDVRPFTEYVAAARSERRFAMSAALLTVTVAVVLAV